MRIYGVTGWKNSGKTTLVERLVAEITGRGLTVATLKHAHHAFDVDQPGKDSHRHRAAGAAQVLVASARRWALMPELRGAPEPPLDALLARLDPVDLVLVEGYKRDRHPKIEARRAATAQDLIAAGDETIEAVASDAPLPGVAVPVFDLDDVPGIADFILAPRGARGEPAFRHRRHRRLVLRAAPPRRARPSPDARLDRRGAGGRAALLPHPRRRARLARRLPCRRAAAGRRVLAGFDFPFGYPRGFAAALTGRAEALAVWEYLADRIVDGPDNANNRFEVAAALNARLPGTGPFWGRPAGAALPGAPRARPRPLAPVPRAPAGRGAGALGAAHLEALHRRLGRRAGADRPAGALPAARIRARRVRSGPSTPALRRPTRRSCWPRSIPRCSPRRSRRRGATATSSDAVQVRVAADAYAALDAAGGLAPLFAPGPAAGRARDRRAGGGLDPRRRPEAALRAAAAAAARRLFRPAARCRLGPRGRGARAPARPIAARGRGRDGAARRSRRPHPRRAAHAPAPTRRRPTRPWTATASPTRASGRRRTCCRSSPGRAAAGAPGRRRCRRAGRCAS